MFRPSRGDSFHLSQSHWNCPMIYWSTLSHDVKDIYSSQKRLSLSHGVIEFVVQEIDIVTKRMVKHWCFHNCLNVKLLKQNMKCFVFCKGAQIAVHERYRSDQCWPLQPLQPKLAKKVLLYYQLTKFSKFYGLTTQHYQFGCYWSKFQIFTTTAA